MLRKVQFIDANFWVFHFCFSITCVCLFQPYLPYFFVYALGMSVCIIISLSFLLYVPVSAKLFPESFFYVYLQQFLLNFYYVPLIISGPNRCLQHYIYLVLSKVCLSLYLSIHLSIYFTWPTLFLLSLSIQNRGFPFGPIIQRICDKSSGRTTSTTPSGSPGRGGGRGGAGSRGDGGTFCKNG